MKTVSYPPSNGFFRSSLFRHIILYAGLLLLLDTISQAIDITAETSSNTWEIYKNVSMSTVEIIKINGYAAEIHHVITEDGYILELHQIPSSKSGQKPTRNHPVFLHHAFLSSSAGWVLGGPNTSLSMQLADDGYDVWLANSRGNTYSKKHVLLNIKKRAYWNFSLHEIGTYDLPAAIDYILTQTNASQLHYIGYSMGTTVFFIMASERPEYQSKIRSQISLAPVAYLSHIRSPIKYIAPYARMMNIAYQRISNGMVMPQTTMNMLFASTVCGGKMMQRLICQRGIIFFVSGSDPQHFNTKLIPLIIGHFPSRTSSMVPEHFAQIKLKDVFGRYDYGPVMNLERYNSTKPPAYDLTSIRVPITLMYGKNDLVADVQDVMRLKSQLPRLIDAVMIDNPYCNHVDFLWSLKVNEHVNNPIKETLRKTDDVSWRYSGPNPPKSKEGSNVSGDGSIGSSEHVNISGSATNIDLSGIVVISDNGDVDITDSEHFNTNDSASNVSSSNGSGRTGRSSNIGGNDVPSGLNYFAKNLGKIIADAMPKSMDHEDDAVVFERERALQETLLADVIEFVRSVQKKYEPALTGQKSLTRGTTLGESSKSSQASTTIWPINIERTPKV
ncbi:lipase 3-like [Melanaphis sacchari]|uniref:lipase 3-like n=1 Tax=Melanaphis sacchari TaxID=742174 RepID=UPI000DC13853|nr:lipase 3-like [Melanaphis sacchari]